MAVSIVCQVEGWVVRKSPQCEECYWYDPGTEKEVESVEGAIGCDSSRPMRTLGPDE